VARQAWQGWAWQGEARQARRGRRGKAWRGEAGPGEATHGDLSRSIKGSLHLFHGDKHLEDARGNDAD